VTLPCYLLADEAGREIVVRQLSRQGWSIRACEQVPDDPWDLFALRIVVVADTRDTAGELVQAVARGAGLVVLTAARTDGQDLLHDLERLGPVLSKPVPFLPRSSEPGQFDQRHLEPGNPRPGNPRPGNPRLGHLGLGHLAGEHSTHQELPGLSAAQFALLDRLAAGESIASAAEAEFLSLRTANRRIAEARTQLRVRTTREAVLEYLRRRNAHT
jgi:DNA-binding CsgD family transcriptional regulator